MTPQARRMSALRRVFAKGGAQSMLVSSQCNVRYFSGFTGEDSYLLVGRAWATLLTDGRFTEQARTECPKAIKVFIRDGRMLDAIVEGLLGRGVRRLGIEGNHVTVAVKNSLDGGLGGIKTKVFSGEIDALREVKDETELAGIRKAVAVAESAFLSLLKGGQRKFVGRTERQVAAELEYQMRAGGADNMAFETIVACGPHAALPHYRAGDTRIRAGEPVLIDWGAVVGGYHSDLTRVVFTGRIPAQIGRIYELVRRAQLAGIAAVKAGVNCEKVDEAARAVIAAGGFGYKFSHGLGHGVGLEIHESPRLGKRAVQKLQAGMVVTVEPGIYLPGVGGVRIEDDVLVTASGRRRLSHLPTDLDEMVLR